MRPQKLTFYTTPVLLLFSDSSITVCVHRNSLQCCKMTQRRVKREKTKALESYTMNPEQRKGRRRTVPRQQNTLEVEHYYLMLISFLEILAFHQNVDATPNNV